MYTDTHKYGLVDFHRGIGIVSVAAHEVLLTDWNLSADQTFGYPY